MSRSIKKGPFAAPSTLRRIDEIEQVPVRSTEFSRPWSPLLGYFPVLCRTHRRRPSDGADKCSRVAASPGISRPNSKSVSSHPHVPPATRRQGEPACQHRQL